MAKLAEMLVRISNYLDAGRPDVGSITVHVLRSTAMKAGAKPETRGGPLKFRGREVVATRKPGETRR